MKLKKVGEKNGFVIYFDFFNQEYKVYKDGKFLICSYFWKFVKNYIN